MWKYVTGQVNWSRDPSSLVWCPLDNAVLLIEIWQCCLVKIEICKWITTDIQCKEWLSTIIHTCTYNGQGTEMNDCHGNG